MRPRLARPEQRSPRAEVFGGSNDRDIENGIVAAIDSDLAGVVDEQSRQRNFDEDDIRRAAPWNARQEPAFADLDQANGEQCELFMDFRLWRQERQSGEEQKPEPIHPVENRTLLFAAGGEIAQGNTAVCQITKKECAGSGWMPRFPGARAFRRSLDATCKPHDMRTYQTASRRFASMLFLRRRALVSLRRRMRILLPLRGRRRWFLLVPIAVLLLRFFLLLFVFSCGWGRGLGLGMRRFLCGLRVAVCRLRRGLLRFWGSLRLPHVRLRLRLWLAVAIVCLSK